MAPLSDHRFSPSGPEVDRRQFPALLLNVEGDLLAFVRSKADRIADRQSRLVLLEVAATWDRLAQLEQSLPEWYRPDHINRHLGLSDRALD